jgi:hypothetical protein
MQPISCWSALPDVDARPTTTRRSCGAVDVEPLDLGRSVGDALRLADP